MTESQALMTFLLVMGIMIVVGAILPTIAPGLIRLLDNTVLKGEHREHE